VPAALTSPGRATAERQALEDALAAQVDSAVHNFIAATRRAALAEATTSGHERFTLGQVLHAWTAVTDALVMTLRARGLDEDYLRTVERRSATSETPPAVYDSARATLTLASTERWSPARTARELTAALDPDTPHVQITLTAASTLAPTPQSTASTAARRLARTEATSAYGHASLRAAVAFGHSTKKWHASADSHTRPTHRAVSGTEIPVSQTFIVGGAAMMYPGDPSAPFDETANCRCVIQ
jgi:hypothetical protein